LTKRGANLFWYGKTSTDIDCWRMVVTLIAPQRLGHVEFNAQWSHLNDAVAPFEADAFKTL
jgi:hypothetical protein